MIFLTPFLIAITAPSLTPLACSPLKNALAEPV